MLKRPRMSGKQKRAEPVGVKTVDQARETKTQFRSVRFACNQAVVFTPKKCTYVMCHLPFAKSRREGGCFKREHAGIV